MNPEISPLPDSLSSLPPHIRQVAERHGPAMFIYCINIMMANESLAAIATLTRKEPVLRRSTITLAAALNQLASGLVEARGWTEAAVAECQADIGRAAALAEGGMVLDVEGKAH